MSSPLPPPDSAPSEEMATPAAFMAAATWGRRGRRDGQRWWIEVDSDSRMRLGQVQLAAQDMCTTLWGLLSGSWAHLGRVAHQVDQVPLRKLHHQASRPAGSRQEWKMPS